MFEKLDIKSHRGTYSAFFQKDVFKNIYQYVPDGSHFIIDANIARLYSNELSHVLGSDSTLIIEAKEENKSLDKFPAYIEHLVEKKVRRNHCLVAIGGGITQDIVCFISTTLLRGIPWIFFPTTLLAQADSCIGSKSSINVGEIKNILGSFTPPEKIYIDPSVLNTLDDSAIRSGIGEMLKVHGIAGPEAFDEIAGDIRNITADNAIMQKYIAKSLEIKKQLIEIDEFDQGPRNVMNYGHSFGHAIESATGFEIPHGIAVSIGADMANYVAYRLGITTQDHFLRMNQTLSDNFHDYAVDKIPVDRFFNAIAKDKKNTDTQLRLILPDSKGKISVGLYNNDEQFKKICTDYFRKNDKK